MNARDRGTADRVGGWMQTYTGKAYYHADPRPEDIDILDIAHALASLCRFGGHTSRFYSVAEHSLLVSKVVPRQHAFAALMHDATEAYVVDMPRPLKHALGGRYDEFEALAWTAICAKYRIDPDLHPSIKMADNTVLLAERNVLLQEPPVPWHWAAGLEPAGVRVVGLPPKIAKALFLSRFSELFSERRRLEIV